MREPSCRMWISNPGGYTVWIASLSAANCLIAASSAESGNLRSPTFAGLGTLKGNASRVSCMGEPRFVHRPKVDSIPERHSARFMRARLFLRYALEMRIEKTRSALSKPTMEGACMLILSGGQCSRRGGLWRCTECQITNSRLLISIPFWIFELAAEVLVGAGRLREPNHH